MTRRLALILVVVVAFHTAINAARPMTSFRALSLGASVEQLGLLTVAFAGLGVLLAIPFGRLVDRWGAKRFVIGACLLVLAASVVLWMADTLPLVFVAQPLVGVGQLAGAVSLQTLIASAGAAERADSRFGSLAAGVAFAQFAGPAAAGLLAEFALAHHLVGPGDIHGATFVFPIAAGLAAGGALLALRLTDSPHGLRQERTTIGTAVGDVLGVIRQRGMVSALIVSVVVFGATDLLTVYLPAYGDAAGWSVGYVSLLLSVRAAASFALRIAFTPMLRLLGRRGLLVAGCVAAAVSAAIIPLVGTAILPVVLIAVYGFAVGAGQPLSMAWVSRAAPAGLRSTGLGVRLTVNQLWLVVAPPIVASILALAGPASLFFTMAALLGGSIVPAIRAPLADSGNAPPLAE